MSDFLLIDNDTAMFLPAFGLASVVVRNGVLKASGKLLVSGSKICLEGDESQVVVSGCMYTTPIYTVPGTGIIKIKSLTDNHKSKSVFITDKPVLLKGGQFTAEFSVTAPAQTLPSPSVTTDSTSAYSGNGQFLTKNAKMQIR